MAETAETANFSKATLMRVGRLLNPGEEKGHLAKLAEMSGATRKAIRNWTLPESDPQHRKMPATAKRSIALLAYLSMTGFLNQKRMAEILALESAMEADQEAFMKAARQVSRVLRKTGVANDTEDQPAEGAAAAE